MIGGKVRDKLETYVTGPEAKLAQDWGHVGSKIPLPYGPGAVSYTHLRAHET